MGVDDTGTRAQSWNVAPEWTQLLEKLGGYGVDAEMVEENIEFVKGFLAGAEAVRSSPASTPMSTPPCTSDEEDDYFHVPCKSLELISGIIIVVLTVLLHTASKSKHYESPRRKPAPHYPRY